MAHQLPVGLESGARNLLQHCAHLSEGHRLLILHEPKQQRYYDEALAEQIAQQAQDMGVDAQLIEVPFTERAIGLNEEVVEAMAQADCSLFLARIGDQLRFTQFAPGRAKVVSYALDPQMLASGFGTAHYDGFIEIKSLLDTQLAAAQNVRVTCSRGTDFGGKWQDVVEQSSDVTIARFPMLVHTPVPNAGFNGRVALPGFLVGCGSNFYEPYHVPFDNQLFAHFDGNRLTHFEGSNADIERAEEHYRRIANLFDIKERNYVHSWHAGIHPGSRFDQPASSDWVRWSGGSFGNPRLLHFHTCGDYAPGEISWMVIDPTVEVDGVAVWEGGRLRPERLTGGEDVLRRYPCAKALFDNPETAIGL